MRKTLVGTIILIVSLAACKKDNNQTNSINGKWNLLSYKKRYIKHDQYLGDYFKDTTIQYTPGSYIDFGTDGISIVHANDTGFTFETDTLKYTLADNKLVFRSLDGLDSVKTSVLSLTNNYLEFYDNPNPESVYNVETWIYASR